MPSARRQFDADEMIQVWVVHHIEILGEAAGAVSRSLRQEHPEIPWQRIVGMRNILAHQYFGIDLDRVWSVVTNDLPLLRTQMTALLERLRVEK